MAMRRVCDCCKGMMKPDETFYELQIIKRIPHTNNPSAYSITQEYCYGCTMEIAYQDLLNKHVTTYGKIGEN